MGHVVDLTKIMVHPQARGLGLGRTVMDALIERADGYGAELLTLGVRGNNHGGRLPYCEMSLRAEVSTTRTVNRSCRRRRWATSIVIDEERKPTTLGMTSAVLPIDTP